MIVGTYRPFEVLLHKHPLRSLTAELRPYPQCQNLCSTISRARRSKATFYSDAAAFPG